MTGHLEHDWAKSVGHPFAKITNASPLVETDDSGFLPVMIVERKMGRSKINH